MNLNRKIVSFAAAGALTLGLLSGCSSLPGKGSDATPAPTPAGTPAPRPEGVPEDIVLQCAGIPRDTVLMTVDGEPIDAESLLYWVAYSADQMAQYGAPEDWSTDLGGMTMEDYIMNNAKQTAQLYRVVETQAKSSGYTLTAEDEAAYQEQVAQIKAQMATDTDPDGELGFQQWLAYIGRTEEGFRALNEAGAYFRGLKESLFGEGGSQAPTADAVTAWVEESGVLSCKHILIQAVASEDGSDDGMAAALETANAIRQDLKDNGDDAAYFDTVMAEKSQDPGSKSQPDGYYFYTDGSMLDGSGTMVSEFAEGTAALAVGAVSEPVQSSYGYHIILRLEPETDAVKGYYSDEKMNAQVDAWMKDAKVETTEAYDALKPQEFYANLNTMRQEMAKAMQPEVDETPAPSPSASAEPVG